MLTRTRTLSVLCAATLLVMLVLQFVPYWHVDGEAFSIQKLIWFPGQCGDLSAFLSGHISDFFLGDMVAAPLLLLVSGVTGMACCLLWMRSPFPVLLAAVCGLCGIWGFGFMPALQLGGSCMLQLLLSIVLLICAAGSLVLNLLPAKKAA